MTYPLSPELQLLKYLQVDDTQSVVLITDTLSPAIERRMLRFKGSESECLIVCSALRDWNKVLYIGYRKNYMSLVHAAMEHSNINNDAWHGAFNAACASKHLDMVKFVINASSDKFTNEWPYTWQLRLEYACQQGCPVEILQCIIDSAPDEFDLEFALISALYKDINIIAFLIKMGAHELIWLERDIMISVLNADLSPGFFNMIRYDCNHDHRQLFRELDDARNLQQAAIYEYLPRELTLLTLTYVGY